MRQHPFAAASSVALDAITLETNSIHFKLDVDEWKDNDKKVRLALTLLPKWVDPAIRGKVQEYENPKEAWENISERTIQNDKSALKLAKKNRVAHGGSVLMIGTP